MAFASTERKPLFPPAHDGGSVQNGAMLLHNQKVTGPIAPPKAVNGPIFPPKTDLKSPKSEGAKNGPIFPPRSPKAEENISPRSPKAEGNKKNPIFPPRSPKAEGGKNHSIFPPKSKGSQNDPLKKMEGVKNGPILPPKSPRRFHNGPSDSPKNDGAFILPLSPAHDISPELQSWFVRPRASQPTNRPTSPEKSSRDEQHAVSKFKFPDDPFAPLKLPGSSFPPKLGTRVQPKSETFGVTQNGRMEFPESDDDSLLTPTLEAADEAQTVATSKLRASNGSRGSMRLIRIEPTMPGKTLSVYSSESSPLSVLEESGNSHHANFPCSISPGTLQSMELLFSFSDTDILDKLAGSWPAKCTYIVKEVIETERTYVKSLTDIIKGYLTPMYSYVLENGESPNFISSVFGNIVKIHQIHTALLESMQSASTKPEDFGLVFLDCDFLSQYTVYCTNYSRGNKRLEQTLANESDIKHFIVDCQKKLSHTLPLTSYLIKPVQRILKYPLLLEDLNRKFDWTDHPGHRKLKQAQEKMSSVAVQINTAFNEQVKVPGKNSPKVIAQRRRNQIKDLQKSRSLDPRQLSPAHQPMLQSNSLPNAYSNVSLFPVASFKNNSLNRFSHLEEKGSASARPLSLIHI